MPIKILYVERKFHEYFSLEKVFRQVAESLSDKFFEIEFEQVKYLSNISGIIKNLLTYKPRRADVYHITGHITYLALIMPRRQTILTVPDLLILGARRGLRAYFIKKLFFELPVRRMKYVTAISQFTKDEIVKHTSCPPDKIRVIEVPLDEQLQAGPKNEFNAECPTILQVGTAPHKNLPNVIKALEGISCRLVIIGRLDEATRQLLKEKNISYHNEFDLDEEAVRRHYQTADMTVFCSFIEGFGLPIIESQAMKTPVITSNLDPMKEVAGDGALLVDPNNYLEIREAVKNIIGKKALRDDLAARGIENIMRYHHRVIAEKYENLYKEVYEKNQI